MTRAEQRQAGIEKLIDTAIAALMSESGVAKQVRGDPEWATLYEPWPEMDALMGALDEVRPGWRDAVL